jgi:serine/threonine protein kinase
VKGKYGKVYKGKCRGCDVAIKVPMNQKPTRKELESLQKELRIMSDLQHPNVCLFMGACLERNNIQFVTELMDGDINSLITSKTDYSSISTRVGWGLEVAKGICWMHSKTPAIIHMDIKPENILYDSQGRIKVCDFGLSEINNQNGKRLTRPVGFVFTATLAISMLTYY